MSDSEGTLQPVWSGALLADHDAAVAALALALEAEQVARRPRLGALLRYVVAEELEGRGDRLKAFNIAIDVFGRDEEFDPQSDSIVRVEMFRLRKALSDYYDAEGAEDSVRIGIPKGSYRPTFAVAETAREPVMPGEKSKPPPAPSARVLTLRADLAACAAIALIGMGYCVADVVIGDHDTGTMVSGPATGAIHPASYRISEKPTRIEWRPKLSFDQQVP